MSVQTPSPTAPTLLSPPPITQSALLPFESWPNWAQIAVYVLSPLLVLTLILLYMRWRQCGLYAAQKVKPLVQAAPAASSLPKGPIYTGDTMTFTHNPR
jgi:hypothetical protein